MYHERMKQQSVKGKHDLEKVKIELEYLKLKLLQESKMNTDSSVESAACGSFPLHQNVKLVSKFNEHDPDVFFHFLNASLKYRVGPKLTVLLLQFVLVDKAQLAFSALTTDECKNYDTVKSAVLKVYECMPETYRQRFRSCKIISGQTHLELVQDLRRHVTHWCASIDVETFVDLLELIIIEQFKFSVSEQIVTYVNEHKVKSSEEAAHWLIAYSQDNCCCLAVT